jgi:hypothetical protein
VQRRGVAEALGDGQDAVVALDVQRLLELLALVLQRAAGVVGMALSPLSPTTR